MIDSRKELNHFCTENNLSPVQIVGARKAWNQQQKKIDELQATVNAMTECMNDAIRLIDEGNTWDAKELLK